MVENLETLLQRAEEAQKIFATFDQEQVDKIFKAAAKAANKARIPLAQMAVEETGMGIVEDKVVKNHFAAEYIYNKYKDVKTCGIIKRDVANGIRKVAEPVGVIAGIVPTTNPTSTAIFKALLAIKTRNAIIFAPHPRAKRCTVEAAKIVLEAAVEAGAPQHIIGWISEPSLDLSSQLLKDKRTALILATGGPGMVKAAYSSGTPSLGVGAGNTPAVIDETADIKMAVSSILLSKTFDHGVICASEQSAVVVGSVYEEVKNEFQGRGAYILNSDEKKRLGDIIIVDGELNSKIVGKPAVKIAEMAGISVPENTKILIGETTSTAHEEPFSHEKLSPILALYRADNFEQAVDIARVLVDAGGAGHTSVLYTDERKSDRIDYFSGKLLTGRILINSPSSHGGIGDIYNFRLEPSLTLGCGTWGSNSVSENVGVKHLLNIKTVAERRENMLWYKVPPKIYFKRGSVGFALKELRGKKRALIITDKPLFDLGMTASVTNVLDEIEVGYQIFFDVNPDPDLSTIEKAMVIARAYQPDVIIALGGGSPIDAAKIIWLMYEQPDAAFDDLAMRFLDIRKKIAEVNALGGKAEFVAIPTTSGTGSEVTRFAVITDDRTGIKYPLVDYALTPSMAIIDPDLVDTMPKSLCAAGGLDALTHAIEAYASCVATNFTDSNSLEAIRLIFKYLPRSYSGGKDDPIAREKMHYASTIAGMAFANAFLGVGHSMAHKLGSLFHIPHGIANALLISQVIRFNATDAPVKQVAFPQYKFPNAKAKYGQIVDSLHFGGNNDDEKVNILLNAISKLKQDVGVALSIKDYGVNEADFMAKLDELAELAFDDQCTGSNSRYPLIDELKQLYVKAYYGDLG